MKKQIVTLIMTLAIVMMALPQPVSAEERDDITNYCVINFEKLKDMTYLVPKNGKCDELQIPYVSSDNNEPSEITIKSPSIGSVQVSFSDPSVASCEVEKSRSGKETTFLIGNLKSKKIGTTTMTISIKVRETTREYSCQLKFEKYQKNPLKSFKLGTKNFSSAFSPQKAKVDDGAMPGTVVSKTQKLELKKKQKKVKVSIKMKDGYQLRNLYKSSFKKVKNGKAMKLASYEKDEVYMYAEYVDKTNTVHMLCMPVKIKRK